MVSREFARKDLLPNAEGKMSDYERIGLDRNTPEGASVDFAAALSRSAHDPRTSRWMIAALVVPVLFVGGVVLMGMVFG